MMMCCYVWSLADSHRHFCCDIRESLLPSSGPSYVPQQIIDHRRFRAWWEPRQPLSIDCTSVWPSAPGRTPVPDGRTDGRTDCRTDGLLRERLAGWSPVLYTSFYIFGYPVQPCTEIWRYILRLFSFNSITLAIYSRKKKKGIWKKKLLSHSQAFF